MATTPFQFSHDQVNSFMRNYMYPRSETAPFDPHSYMRSQMCLPPDQPIEPEHYSRFVNEIIQPNALRTQAWDQHIGLLPPSEESSQDATSYDVKILSVQEVPLPESSSTGAAAGRLRRFSSRRGVEPSLRAAGAMNSVTGPQYQSMPMYRDEGDDSVMRTNSETKLLLVAMLLSPSVEKYEGYNPKYKPVSPFLISQSHLDDVQKASHLRFPSGPEQPWQQPLAMGKSVNFNIVSDQASEIEKFHQMNPNLTWPPNWVVPTTNPPPPSTSQSSATGGRAGSISHPRSRITGKFIQQTTAAEEHKHQSSTGSRYTPHSSLRESRSNDLADGPRHGHSQTAGRMSTSLASEHPRSLSTGKYITHKSATEELTRAMARTKLKD